MAEKGVLLDKKTCCLICLDLLKDPVTVSCGHSYCNNCINSHWDKEDRNATYSCPKCRKSLTARPDQAANTTLAELVEELKNSGINVGMNGDGQTELGSSRQKIKQRIETRQNDVKLLKLEVEKINLSADKALKESRSVFDQLSQQIKKRSFDVMYRIRSLQKAEQNRIKALQEKLEQEITDLKRKDAELEELSHTEDHNQFLHHLPSFTHPPTELPRAKILPLRFFEEVTAAVSELRAKVQDILRDTWVDVSPVVDVNPQVEPKTRADFLKYSFQITLDPNTANTQLSLSEGNRRATLMREEQSYPTHPDRFVRWRQVLSNQSLTGRRYWEVEWCRKRVTVALAYKDISREGSMNECAFGFNDKSWALECNCSSSYKFIHNSVKTAVSGPWTSRLGVYLDHSAGVLAFYSVSETMTLLHRVQTTFNQPLYAGLWFSGYHKATAEFIELGA
uniref:Tripartite motif-containing protein 16-like n=1 Tax=Oreochromis niloticus TaxID=8128 RepID=A0A669FB20_ORENI